MLYIVIAKMILQSIRYYNYKICIAKLATEKQHPISLNTQWHWQCCPQELNQQTRLSPCCAYKCRNNSLINTSMNQYYQQSWWNNLLTCLVFRNCNAAPKCPNDSSINTNKHKHIQTCPGQPINSACSIFLTVLQSIPAAVTRINISEV